VSAESRFDALSRGLIEGVRSHPDLLGLALLGSASDAGAARRDEWSDHDFFAIIRDGRGSSLRPELGWLPDQEHLVLTAREGEIGFVAVYDDGHVFEFALAETGELAGAMATDASVVVDEDDTTADLIAAAQRRTRDADGFDPANDARLVLVKLLIGVGRARRGELLNAGQFVRTWAVNHLVRAVRGRNEQASTDQRDRIDPVRRFERDHPDIAARIDLALAQDVEHAARDLHALMRDVLEPGWDEFPSVAADMVARRLGW